MKLTRACIMFVSALATAPIIAADAPPVPVVVTTARSENVGASLAATGTVVSRSDARISTEVAGLLAWIAEPGSAVKRGATIARIDPVRLALTLRDNNAALKRFEAQLSLLATQRARFRRWALWCRRASRKRPCLANAWRNRTWSRRGSRGIEPVST